MASVIRALRAMSVALVCGISAAAQDEPIWDYFPIVGYDSDTLVFSLRVGADAGSWSAAGKPGKTLAADIAGGVITARLEPAVPTTGEVVFSGGGATVPVRLVHPGGSEELVHDEATAHISCGGFPAVLLLERVEAEADRRWKIFRTMGGDAHPIACDVVIEAPKVAMGSSGLLALLCVAHAREVKQRSLLVLLPGSDRFVGWKHREYRQAVAWLVSDALARGAQHVVLAGPIAAKSDAVGLAPLRDQIADVANAYRCRRLPLENLCDDRYWTIADGFLGSELNQVGKAALAEALAPWRKP
jgi:hypothetical protein